MTSLSNLSLNIGTVGPQYSFVEVLDAAVKHGFMTVSPWRHHYEALGAEAAARELKARDIKVDGVCRISGFGPATSPAEWSQALDEAKATIDEAAILGSRSIVYPGGGVGQSGAKIEDTRKRIAEGLAELVPLTRQAGIEMLVEPLHPVVTADRGAINTLALAIDLCEAVGEGTGVMVDSYNVWWDPQLEASIKRAGNLVRGFQVSDWLYVTRHTAFDRGMVGDGVIDFARIRALVDATGFDGPIEIEAMSDLDLWARDIDDLLATSRQRLERHLASDY